MISDTSFLTLSLRLSLAETVATGVCKPRQRLPLRQQHLTCYSPLRRIPPFSVAPTHCSGSDEGDGTRVGVRVGAQRVVCKHLKRVLATRSSPLANNISEHYCDGLRNLDICLRYLHASLALIKRGPVNTGHGFYFRLDHINLRLHILKFKSSACCLMYQIPINVYDTDRHTFILRQLVIYVRVIFP